MASPSVEANFNKLSTFGQKHLAQVVGEAFDVTPGVASFFQDGFLQQKKWAAVIFEGDFRDDREEISRQLVAKEIFNVACGGLADYMTDWYLLEARHDFLGHVKHKYFEPSYFITDYMEKFCIVSDSDYYWAIGAEKVFLEEMFVRSGESILQEFKHSIEPLLKSKDNHNRSIGLILESYLLRCFYSMIYSEGNMKTDNDATLEEPPQKSVQTACGRDIARADRCSSREARFCSSSRAVPSVLPEPSL